MRGAFLGVLGLLVGVLAWAVETGAPAVPTPPQPQVDAASSSPDHLICPVADFIRSDTRLSLLASHNATVDLQHVAEGEWAPYGQVELGPGGGWSGDVPSGPGTLLFESGAKGSAAGMVNHAAEARSAWLCGESSTTLMALGGSTLAGDRLDLLLYNPYVWDSTVRVEIISELGEDTPAGLEEIYVPAGRVVRVGLDESLRLRRFLGVGVESSPGKVGLLLRQTGNEDTAMVEASIPRNDWWLPVPDLGQTDTHLLVGSPSESSFSYRIDLMTESGPIYGFVEDELLPGSLVATPLTDLPPDVTGIGVFGTVPLVAALRMDAEGLLAAGPGASGSRRQWMPAGAGGGAGRTVAWLLNPSPRPVSVAVSAAAEGAFSYRVTVAPESVLAFDLDRLGEYEAEVPGFLVDADDDIAVVWTSQTEGGAAAYSAGVPVER